MTDIFDQKILCGKCNSKMEKSEISKNGFIFRTMLCPNKKCSEKIIHPADESEYNKFINLRNKEFQVKMRLVGNSYAVSIPMEIVNFMNEQQNKMNEMVKLSFENMGRLSLNFNTPNLDGNSNARVIKTREIKILKDGKFVHSKQFSDSAHPERNKNQIIKKNIEDDR
ncbi:MAG: hypothetical protein QT10_C0013G0016 [archaeon GW2011_AR19]|nr:MAG: hypothetical protein QT10_C0013G0016 [archaeon GW2011_AR19]